MQLLVPALFYFIPGDAITAAALELATNRLTAGAARLVYSVAMLLILAFGALLATVLLGVPHGDLFDVEPGTLGPLWTWTGWLLFAVGGDARLLYGGPRLPVGARPHPRHRRGRRGRHPRGGRGGRHLPRRGRDDRDRVARLAAAGTPARVRAVPGRVLRPDAGVARPAGLESWIGGHPVQGVTGVADMVGLIVAIAVGMLVGAAAVASRRP
ncbi:threonine/serine exporter family protein [Virgisporangium ochraceum]|uniref:threonine/serine exporter family protein n=1 Tax=Virgisporangium ochraceum TaxID=65505 RepID=UPI0035A236D6